MSMSMMTFSPRTSPLPKRLAGGAPNSPVNRPSPARGRSGAGLPVHQLERLQGGGIFSSFREHLIANGAAQGASERARFDAPLPHVASRTRLGLAHNPPLAGDR